VQCGAMSMTGAFGINVLEETSESTASFEN
jgi:hypothetical protein